MKQHKVTFLSLGCLVILIGAGCAPAPEVPTAPPVPNEMQAKASDDDMSMNDEEMADSVQNGAPESEDHFGCSENEYSLNGTCTSYSGDDAGVSAYPDLVPGAVVTSSVEYADGVTGYYAAPNATGTYPGIVMIHEWWGLNENIEMMAELLAQEGYVVLAADIYEGEVASEFEQARALSSEARANTEETLANMEAAITYLQTQENVRPDRIASLGWCFGGAQSLNLALASDELTAMVMYYGSVRTSTAALEGLDEPVLGIFGQDDSSIPVQNVNAFATALDDMGTERQIIVYPGVGHAFANPSGDNHAPIETADAWEKTLTFLEGYLQ